MPGKRARGRCPFLREHSMERLPEAADAVITSAAGYPLDLTFYQTDQGDYSGRAHREAARPHPVAGRVRRGHRIAAVAEKLRVYAGPESFFGRLRIPLWCPTSGNWKSWR